MLVQERHIQPGAMNDDDRAALLASLHRATDTQTGAQMQVLRNQQEAQDARARSHRATAEAGPNQGTRHRSSEKLGSLVINEIKDRFTKYIARPIGRLASAAIGLFRPAAVPAPAVEAPHARSANFNVINFGVLRAVRLTATTVTVEAPATDREFSHSGGVRREQAAVIGGLAVDDILLNLAVNFDPSQLDTFALDRIGRGLVACDSTTPSFDGLPTSNPTPGPTAAQQNAIAHAMHVSRTSTPYNAFAAGAR